MKFLVVLPIAAAGVNILMAFIGYFRTIRTLRWNREIREVIWAYEKELIVRGVSLPPRCAYCVQLLPRHVKGCQLGHEWYEGMAKLEEMITRPPIKWYPKGQKPPDFGGPKSA
jgi:hypothetical protein